MLISEGNDYAHNIGMVMRLRSKEHRYKSDYAEVAPVTLFPTPVPRQIFDQAHGVQEAMTLLYFRISCDHEFLIEHLSDVARTDETLNFLMSVLHQIREEGIRQPIGFIWERADYMIHEDKDDEGNTRQYQLKQIEVNNGAAAGYIGEHVTQYHRRMLSKAGIDYSNMLPENRLFTTVSKAIHQAWLLFGDPNAIVVVMYKANTLTQFVDFEIMFHLDKLEGGKIKTVYLNVEDAHKKLSLAPDFSLILEGQKVGVVFYRATFLRPPKFFSRDAWEARRTIERSTAIKCPNIGTLLASTKKIQQILALPGMVERFFPDPKDNDKVAAIRATFAGLWGLDKDDDETNARIQHAIAHPERYVLKPNREGGGNNIWGPEIAKKLRTFTLADRAEHILMQRLNPMVSKNFFVWPRHYDDDELEAAKKKPIYSDVVVELGTFGYIIGNTTGDKKVLHSDAHGYFMRTKCANTDECGINAGQGVYDTPLLI